MSKINPVQTLKKYSKYDRDNIFFNMILKTLYYSLVKYT